MADQFDDRYSSQAAVDLARRLAVPRSEKVAPPSRRAATPAMFAQNAYYPEDENRNAERQRLLENNWMEWYKQNLSPEAIRKMTFEYARNELGMSERDAAIQADHAANTATRTGYIADATALAPLAGGAVNFGRQAIKTAEAMAAPRVAGAAAPRAAVNPATDFRLAAEQGPRIGPNRPPEALRPVVDETYTIPEQLNRRPEVTTAPTPAQVLRTESPLADRQLAGRQQAGRDAEAAFRARQEAINADEGYGIPMIQRDKDFAQFQRELAAIEERGAGAQFTPPASAGEPTSPLLSMPAPGVKRRLTPAAEPAPAQPTFDFGGPQSVGGQMVDPLTGRAYMPRQFPQTAPQPASGSFSPVIQGQASATNAYVENAIKIAKQRSDAMARTAADAAAQQNAIDAAALQVKGERARGPYQRSQSANSLIDDAIADATGDVSRQSAIDRAKQRLAAQSAAEEAPAVARPAAAGEAPAAAAPAEKAFSAANVAELRANGFNELADQVEAVLAKNAQAAAAPAAAAATPAAAAPAAAPALPPLGGRLANGLLGAGTVGAGGLAVATADRNERRLQKALAAAQSSQKITDMDEAALNVVRGGEDAPDSLDYLKGRLPAVSTPATVKSTPDWLDDYINRPRSAQTQSQPPAGTPATRSSPAQMPAAPAGGGSFLDKIFSGKDYQSSGGQLQQQQGGNRVLNWGDSDNAADFFRADAMRKRMEDQKQQYTGRSGSDIDYENRMAASQLEGEGKARGGAAEQKPSKEAMLHKSLEIIHHMIKNR